MKVHLILGEFGSVRQYHVLHLGWAVSCGQSQAPQGVTTCPVLTDHRHDLLFDAFAEGNFAVAHSDIGASINNSLWGPLSCRAKMSNIHSKAEDQIKSKAMHKSEDKTSPPFLCCSVYLDKHFAHGRTGLVGGAVDRHGLPVSRELQSELLLHQLLDHLIPQKDRQCEKTC